MLFSCADYSVMVRLNSRKRKAIVMAKRFIITDDIDGTESDSVRTRRVMLEEGTLTIDLSDENYAKIMDALTPFIDKGEWTVRETGNDENTVIREWARQNGYEVSPRGRLPKDVVSAYQEYLKSREAVSQDTADTDADVEPNPNGEHADNGSRELADVSA